MRTIIDATHVNRLHQTTKPHRRVRRAARSLPAMPWRAACLPIVVLLALGLLAGLGGVTRAESPGRTVFLPHLVGPAVCELLADEAQVETLLRSDPGQTRSAIACNPILSRVARQRAEDMARRGYFGHVTPEGFGPNYLVEQAGFNLPDFYASDLAGNNIESIAAGYSTPETVWAGWMDSPGHRSHLLGEDGFYREQTALGVGHFYDPSSSYGHYWVILTAKAAD